MELMPILDASGAPMFRVGGATAWRQYHKHGYVISLEWMRNPDTRRVEPVMLLWSAIGNSADMGVWAMFRSAGSQFATPQNEPTPRMLAEACQALPILGRASLQFEVHQFVDTVMEYMDDLVQMPVAPVQLRDAPKHGQAMWEVTHHMRDDPNKVISEGTA